MALESVSLLGDTTDNYWYCMVEDDANGAWHSANSGH